MGLQRITLLLSITLIAALSYGQSQVLERFIMVTDTIFDEDAGVSIAVSSDDAEQENDAIDALFDDDIDAGWEGAPDQQNILTAGMRFRNITIPPGATIDSAWCVLNSHEGKTVEEVANITICGEAADDPETYNDSTLISDRPRTNSTLLWVVDVEWDLWGFYRTPDLKDIIQEIVDRDGWQSGNSLALMFKGEDQGPSEVDNAREWEAFENISDPADGGDGQNHPERVPQIVIHYTVPAMANMMIDVPIVVTDTIFDEDAGVSVPVSSDDAEQENDAIDALFDDDIDAGWEGAPDQQNILTAGMRFQNIQIPPGSTIDSAWCILNSHEGKTAEEVARITICGEASDNASTYTEDALITDRPPTTATLLWEVDEVWDLWGFYNTPDLKDIIQEIVNREGWQAGNSLALMFKGEDQGPSEIDNAREWESYENISDPADGGDGQNHPERVPRLVIYFTPPPPTAGMIDVPIVVTDTIFDENAGVFIPVSSDDAEQENDAIDALFDDDIDAGWEGAPDQQNILTAGMRFQNIQIPQGATIDSAWCVLNSHEGKTPEEVARLTIYGDATDDAQTFTEDALITDRPSTDASLLWVVDTEWLLWEFYRTPDIKEIIQEIVNRDGWEMGNSLALIFRGENQGPSEIDNAREWESYENISDPADGGDGQNHPERVPRLIVYFTEGTTTGVIELGREVKELLVYPNPTSPGFVNIELETDDASVIRLYDLSGRLIKTTENQAGNQVRFYTGDLPNGTYILQGHQNQELYVQKLVIRE